MQPLPNSLPQGGSAAVTRSLVAMSIGWHGRADDVYLLVFLFALVALVARAIHFSLGLARALSA